MISNILLGVGMFLVGGFFGHVAGAIWITNQIRKANKLYKEDTGNDFVSWLFDKQNEIRKHRVEIDYAAE